jgi:hypothetical protein
MKTKIQTFQDKMIGTDWGWAPDLCCQIVQHQPTNKAHLDFCESISRFKNHIDVCFYNTKINFYDF